MLEPSTGIGLRNFGVDYLHTLSLGVIAVFVGYFVRALIDRNAWNVAGSDQHTSDELSIGLLKAELQAWYKSESKQGRIHSKVQCLTRGLLGPATAPFLGFGGSEMHGFLRFSRDVLVPKYGPVLQDLRRPYSAGIDDLAYLLDVCQRLKRRVPPQAVIQEFCDAVSRHIGYCKQLGIPMRPKHHMAMELGARSNRPIHLIFGPKRGCKGGAKGNMD